MENYSKSPNHPLLPLADSHLSASSEQFKCVGWFLIRFIVYCAGASSPFEIMANNLIDNTARVKGEAEIKVRMMGTFKHHEPWLKSSQAQAHPRDSVKGWLNFFPTIGSP